jgi:hypothetical protein
MYNCSNCDNFSTHLESCHGARSPWLPIIIAIVIALIIPSPAVAATQSALSVEIRLANAPLAGEMVTATQDNALIAIATDATGMAQFGDLAPGDWTISACGQSMTFGSSSGNTAATWMVDCNRLWLPLLVR